MLAVRGLGRVLGDLSESGYDAEWLVMGADDCGAPHRRKRMWILAHSRRGSGRGDFGRESRRLRRGQAEEVGERDSNKAVRPSAASETLADADEVRELQSKGPVEKFGRRTCYGGENMANSKMSRQQSRTLEQGQVQFGRSCAWWDADPADEDGAFESGMGRVADGVADRVDRLKALGNGQVPVVAARAFVELKRRLFE